MLLVKDKELKEAFRKAYFEVTSNSRLLKEDKIKKIKELEKMEKIVLDKVEKVQMENREKIEELKKKRGLL